MISRENNATFDQFLDSPKFDPILSIRAMFWLKMYETNADELCMNNWALEI